MGEQKLNESTKNTFTPNVIFNLLKKMNDKKDGTKSAKFGY